MRKILKYILITSLVTCICNVLFAQIDTSYVLNIKNYVASIDSINNLDYAKKIGFLNSIEDGVIKGNGEIVGGFGIYTLMNLKEDTAYRIEYNGGIDVNINKVYYYKSNQVVFARVELLEKKEVFYHREEFYKDGVKVFTETKKGKKASDYTDEADLSLFDDSLKFLNDFKKANIRR